jgi:uncharacterized membrane protein YfcA
MDFLVLGVVLAGFVAGYVVGALGTAWGAISVPLLILLAVDPAVAIGTSLIAGSVVALIAGGAHWRFGHVKWGILVPLLIAGTAAAILGAWVAVHVPAESLVLAIGAFEIWVGITILLKVPKGKPSSDGRISIGVGGLAGFVKGLFGTGWGPIGTSLLILSGIYPALAIGSSMIARVAVQLAPGLTFMSFGGINLGVMIALAGSGIVGGVLGAFTTNKLSASVVRMLIGTVVVALGALVLLKTLAL